MVCLGVHFALTKEQVSRLDTCCNDKELMEFLEAIEGQWDAACLNYEYNPGPFSGPILPIPCRLA